MCAKGTLVRGGLQVAAVCFGRGFVGVSVDALIELSRPKNMKSRLLNLFRPPGF